MDTYTGKIFHPLSPEPEEICIEDIAHALSLLCRFNGQCREFYSVAEHSIRVSDMLPEDMRLAGLMHDAAEAYIGDLIHPIKSCLPYYREVEKGIRNVIFDKFHVTWDKETSGQVKWADMIMRAREVRDLMTSGGAGWVDELPSLRPEDTACIYPVSPVTAEQGFLNYFYHLGGTCHH